MSWPMTIDSAPSGSATTCGERRRRCARATASSSCSGTSPRTSYALMNSDRLGVLTGPTLVGATPAAALPGPARGVLSCRAGPAGGRGGRPRPVPGSAGGRAAGRCPAGAVRPRARRRPARAGRPGSGRGSTNSLARRTTSHRAGRSAARRGPRTGRRCAARRRWPAGRARRSGRRRRRSGSRWHCHHTRCGNNDATGSRRDSSRRHPTGAQAPRRTVCAMQHAVDLPQRARRGPSRPRCPRAAGLAAGARR